MLDIVIPTHAAVTRLAITLKAISLCSDLDSLGRVVVVENGEKFAAESICAQEFPFQVKYVHTITQGLVNARNLGVEHCDGEFIVFIDDDIAVLPTFVRAYRQAIESYGRRYFYGGPLLAEYEKAPPKWLLAYLPWSAADHYPAKLDGVAPEAVFLGGNMCVSRAALLEAGGYEGLGAVGTNSGGVGEEVRLQKRLIELGFAPVFVGEAAGRHWIPADRCTCAFALVRHKRQAFTEASNDLRVFPQVFGAPRWVWGELIRSFLGRKYFRVNEDEAWIAREIPFYRAMGLLKGYGGAFRKK